MLVINQQLDLLLAQVSPRKSTKDQPSSGLWAWLISFLAVFGLASSPAHSSPAELPKLDRELTSSPKQQEGTTEVRLQNSQFHVCKTPAFHGMELNWIPTRGAISLNYLRLLNLIFWLTLAFPTGQEEEVV